jgi:hypothetical protein
MKVNRDSAVAFGAGLACIALVVGGIVFMQRGDRIELPGKILKVRTAPLDENSAVAVIDFRISNPSGVQFMVRTISVEMDDNEGKSYLGDVAADVDAVRLFEAVPALGQKFLKTLMARERIASHDSQDRMVTARFQAPISKLEARKRFVVRIEEVDGKSFEYPER